MIQNYFKYAFRNLVKQRGRTIINLLGLSFGIACVIIIYLYSSRELNYNNFHENGDRIYRMYLSGNTLVEDKIKAPYFKADMAAAMQEKVPGVEKSCRLRSTQVWIGIGDVLFQEEIGFTDSSFLEMFTFHVIAGDPITPLAFPQSLILTETLANKFFGDSINDYSEIIGESIEFPQSPPNEYTITAIIADPPENNSFMWRALIPYDNSRHYPQCNNLFGNSSIYVMLDEQNDSRKAEETAQLLIEEFHGEALETLLHYSYIAEEGHDFQYHLQPFSELYLGSEGLTSCYENTGNKKSIYILSSIAILILLIACFNYVMISIGSAMNRISDFGIMNVVGARPGHILGNFIIESFVLTLVSLFLGIILAEQILPLFNQLAQEDLQFTLYGDWKNFLFLVFVLLIIVSFTSIYIGLYLLRKNQPLRFLRKEMLSLKRNGVARISVILQYFIAISLMISSAVILKQLQYMVNQEVGFNFENLLVLDVDFPEQKIYTLKDRLLQSSHIEFVSTSDRSFTSGASSTVLKNPSGESFQIRFLRVDPDYISAIGLKLLEGRNFFPDETTEDNYNVIVNEAFIKSLGVEDPLGKQVYIESNEITITIIGIVRDFHFDSMHDEIQPVLLHLFPYNSIWAVFVKLGIDIPSGLRDVEKAWDEIVPEYDLEFKFMADKLESQYKNEDRWSRVIAYAAGIAIFLSCLGLMGISGLLVARRFKEIGIRKANGAKVSQVIILLNIDILKWVLISFLFASPIAYFIMRRWLQDFTFRTNISWWIFALAGTVALLISMLTISLQIYRAARQNPVNALRYE
jgi:putative ABC transport system permease protein